MADKCYCLSFDLFTATLDRDGQVCTNKAYNQNVPICTSKIKTNGINDYTLFHIVPLSIKKWIIPTPKILLL